MRNSLKKASLSLSINAVVILVLAIAMLGLGLGFTKKMFSKFGDTLSIPEPELTASESDPIVLVSDQVEIKMNKDVSMPVKFYSSGAFAATTPMLDCNADGSHDAVFKVAAMDIAAGEQKVWRILMPQGSVGNTSICTLAFESGGNILASKQITLIPTG